MLNFNPSSDGNSAVISRPGDSLPGDGASDDLANAPGALQPDKGAVGLIGDDNPVNNFPVFRSWKGAIAQDALRIFWEVSGGDKDFILTMAAENGSFDPFIKHPNRNRDGSWDYSFGLNSYYHKEMIARILKKEISIKEIAEYHWKVYNQPDWTTSCGKKKFCGYNRRAKVKNMILFP